MSWSGNKEAADERMVQISEWIDRNSESARLQGAALAGVLLGGWVCAGAIELGYTPLSTAIIMTAGTAIAIAIRATA